MHTIMAAVLVPKYKGKNAKNEAASPKFLETELHIKWLTHYHKWNKRTGEHIV